MPHQPHKNQQGYLVIFALLFLFIFILFSTALLNYTTLNLKGVRQSYARTQALYLAQAGIDKAVSQLNSNSGYSGETDTALGSGMFTVSVSAIDSTDKRVTVTGYIPDSTNPIAKQTVKATVSISSNEISFHYGIQAGNGGFSMANSSSVIGNVFSSGSVIGSGSNMIYGDVVSAGSSGLTYGIHATGTVFSHVLGTAGTPTTIDKDAYYVTKTNATVSGTSHPNSPDQPPVPLPISDAQISEWETEAAAGGTISNCDASGNYTISSTLSLGPKKIACNLVVKSSSGILTVTGHLWVTGNITFQTGPTVKIDPALGSTNVAIIADNPGDTTGSGVINVGQTTIFQGSGAVGSFVFLISQNNSAELGGATSALSLSQGASALVGYASHGLINMSQSVSVKEVTAYKIALSQSANVTYDTGLPSTLFQSGPGGSWGYASGSYVVGP